MSDSDALPDLVSRAVGGGVVAANDELFAARENLIKPAEPTYQPYTFGHKGQIYDGWETRRRREEGDDYAIIRLGLPGIVRGLVVDTAFFKGNYPPKVSVQGCGVEGYPSPAELAAADWEEVLPKSPVEGDATNTYEVESSRRYTHLRLSMHPDGGIARLRVPGEPIADPRWVSGQLDLAALENGSRVTGCSNMFYSRPSNLFNPGLTRVMGEGWETARRRSAGNEWVSVRLAVPGILESAELDTSYFVGNAPGWASLSGCDARSGEVEDPNSWVEVLPKTRLQPDTRHRFRLAAGAELTDVRMDIYPDGGMARLRLNGAAGSDSRAELARRWFNALPDAHAREVLTGEAGLAIEQAEELVARRPVTTPPPAVLALLR